MTSKLHKILAEVADVCGCGVEDFIGDTLREVFESIERYYGGCPVFWACWTDTELDIIITE